MRAQTSSVNRGATFMAAVPHSICIRLGLFLECRTGISATFGIAIVIDEPHLSVVSRVLYWPALFLSE